MKKLISRKKIILGVLLLSSAVIIARVPVYNNQTILEQLTSGPNTEPDEAGVIEESREDADKKAPGISKEIWKEIEKLSEHNRDEKITVSGTVRLFDNLDEKGISETEKFTLWQEGENLWFKMGIIDRFQIEQTTILIDHEQKEILIDQGYGDSLMANAKMLSPKQLKKMMEKDGMTAALTTEDGMKKLSIIPGSVDAVNQYQIFYDPISYRIRKIRIYYTSFPYQDYLENYQAATEQNDEELLTDESREEGEMEIEANITEYVVSFEFDKVQNEVNFNFNDNPLFRLAKGEMIFKGELEKYSINKF